MANSPQAIKRARQNKKTALHNAGRHSEVRTAIKKINKLLEAGEKDTASKLFPKAASLIDRIAQKNIIHRNKAARIKSQLERNINKA